MFDNDVVTLKVIEGQLDLGTSNPMQAKRLLFKPFRRGGGGGVKRNFNVHSSIKKAQQPISPSSPRCNFSNIKLL